MHLNSTDRGGAQCKKAVTAGRTLTLDECRIKVKQWLIEGLPLPDSPNARTRHVEMDARRFPPEQEAAVDFRAP